MMTGLFISELERTFKRKKTAAVLAVYAGLLAFIWFFFKGEAFRFLMQTTT